MASRTPPALRPFLGARKRPALAAALAALGGALVLGSTVGPAMPGLWDLFAPRGLIGVLGPVVAGSAALLAFHFARISVAAPSAAAAALPAALVPVAVLPGMGAAALLPTAVLAPLLAVRPGPARPAALLALLASGAAALGANGDGIVVAIGQAAMLGAAAWIAIPARKAAANDDRARAPIWRLPAPGLDCAGRASER